MPVILAPTAFIIPLVFTLKLADVGVALPAQNPSVGLIATKLLPLPIKILLLPASNNKLPAVIVLVPIVKPPIAPEVAVIYVAAIFPPTLITGSVIVPAADELYLK